MWKGWVLSGIHVPTWVIALTHMPERTDILFTTKGQNVATSALMDTSDLEHMLSEEADYRMMLHCFHAYKLGRKTNSTCPWHRCSGARIEMGDCKICLAFGHGLHFGYTAAHTIAIKMGVHYWVFITEVCYSWTHVLDVIWHLHSRLARKQHGRWGSHYFK